MRGPIAGLACEPNGIEQRHDALAPFGSGYF
uniref:Uncharacterized protein n=1 Tax=Ralstonia solanacearum TaxID=305 RepID=A0A0S4TUL7_RALSL|nr:protein of unknown function [Ralstonia solanacearum]